MKKTLSPAARSTLAIIAAAGDAGRELLLRQKGYNIGSANAMTASGLLERTADTVTGRNWMVRLTDAGRAALAGAV